MNHQALNRAMVFSPIKNEKHHLREEERAMKKYRIVFCVLCISAFLVAGIAGASSVEEGEKLLTEGFRTFQKEPLVKARAIFEEKLKEKENDFKALYLLARSLNGLAYVEELNGNKEVALDLVEEAVKYGEQSVNYEGNFSDSHRLLATLYGRLIALKGGSAGAIYAPMNEQQFQEALGLDPKNAKAYLELGIARAFTPPQWGGDIDEGIQAMEKAISIDPDFDMAYYYLGRSLLMKKDQAGAKEILQKGLKVNPHNAFIRKALEE
jgi:tetratricopeptide (TPR) repeat protein